ncbi:hypothetical protein CI594_14295 [Fischerella thermalis CCMEE 5196]|jgi:hypothetical protein|nr:hypothetical protein CI594_14295 [Fischerella thermalis CCMEE 5196]
MLTQLRNTLIGATLAFSTLSVASQQSLAKDIRDFSVHNRNRLAIVGFYVSSQYSDSWGSNILNSILWSGQTTKVTFHDNNYQCIYDVKAVYSNGTYDRGRYNLCRTHVVRFYGYGGDYRSRRRVNSQ